MSKANRPVLITFGCSVALVLVGGIFYPRFLSISYLLQQLQMASFLGIVAIRAVANAQ